jgi:hypothetical protein
VVILYFLEEEESKKCYCFYCEAENGVHTEPVIKELKERDLHVKHLDFGNEICGVSHHLKKYNFSGELFTWHIDTRD